MTNYRKQANAQYNDALGVFKKELKIFEEKYPHQKELYNAANDVITVAKAVKNHKMISSIDDTNKMAEVVRAITECLKDPEFEREETVDVYHKAIQLVSDLPSKAPLKWPLMAILRAFSVISSLIAGKFAEHSQASTEKDHHPSTIFKDRLSRVGVEDIIASTPTPLGTK